MKEINKIMRRLLREAALDKVTRESSFQEATSGQEAEG